MVEPEGSGSRPTAGNGAEVNSTSSPQAVPAPKKTQIPDSPPPKKPGGSKVRGSWPLYLIIVAVAGIVGTLISWGFLAGNLAALGLPDPGPITTAGLPFFRAAGWIFASLAAGSFLFSAFLISPKVPAQSPAAGGKKNRRSFFAPPSDQTAGEDENETPATPESVVAARDRDTAARLSAAPLTVDGHLASRAGSIAAICFGLIGILMIPLVLSDVSGQPFSVAVQPAGWGTALDQVAEAVAWQWAAIFALITGVAGLFTRKWITQPLLFLGSILMIIPLGLEGHSASGGNHDYGTNSLLFHMLFLVLWIGGLMALLAHGRRLGPDLDLALERYSKIAFVAIIAMAASGLVNAGVRIQWSDWFTSNYGLLVVAKTVGVIILGLFGLLHRQRTIPRIKAAADKRGLFLQVAFVELLVMAAVTGVAISMGRTPPPAPENMDLSVMAIAVGWDLPKEPTLSSVWTMWRFDLMLGTIAILMAAAYIRGLIKLRRKGMPWKNSRTAWFLAGCITLGVCMSSGIGMAMPATFSMHMVAHMILSMVVPVFLVLGAPLSLLLVAAEPGAPGRPGLREWVLVAVDNPILKFLTHPAFNTIQFIVIFYILYMTPFYETMISEHAGHLSMNFVFLISGYIYFWEMIGPDPTPEDRSTLGKLGWLVFSMPFHLFFGVYLMQLNVILGEVFYSRLELPWEIDLLADQKVGGGIAWGSGSFPMAIVFGVLFNNLRKEDRQKEKEIDAKAEGDGYEDLDAYNAMLSQMSNRDQQS
ncbi:Cytochrome c oxidase caa3 assembly factor [Corynebacterium occultum]|uniref:Cytochrome c oxidase caa3 assembly factor n=1 Tax=Corynebacterium occultum TaxID=2675219 RepID=A0A6B8WDN2_9CORY|nr:cytochrome c oxidase assembly protein [Corynebacterium occultum]QGU08110.1 Cytochrome c oxidase caa3 assembly factor [Corynebacterium occultum]